MSRIRNITPLWLVRMIGSIASLMAVFALLAPQGAQALPVFARQTGQNCVACHAGGQFPELTPYGRMFKLTGYTIGARTNPLAVMGVINYAKVADTTKTANPGDSAASDFYKNGRLAFASGSLFIAGKMTDNLGLFSQITYDNYASQNLDPTTSITTDFSGHTNVDNFDLRYADRFIDSQRDLIVGVTLNNNPSVSDPWNTAAAWMQYVPAASLGSHQFADANTPYPGFGAGGNLAGVSAYMLWNQTLYAELGTYRTANQLFSFMSGGIPDSGTTHLDGSNNPYWRLALTHEWGPHNIMVGATGMQAHVYDIGSDISDPANLGKFSNQGVDAQYQYLLDPHAFTAQLAYMHQKTRYSDNYATGNGGAVGDTDTTNVTRGKVSYVYQAKYGGSLAYFNQTGSVSSLQSDPATSGLTYEAFWLPKQNIRVGVQYTAYSKYAGASSNYDGAGRNASDNNTLFGYIWFAY